MGRNYERSRKPKEKHKTEWIIETRVFLKLFRKGDTENDSYRWWF